MCLEEGADLSHSHQQNFNVDAVETIESPLIQTHRSSLSLASTPNTAE